MQPRRSLKSRALQLLAQRDQSRVELRRKLLRHAQHDAAAAVAAANVDADADADAEAEPDRARCAAQVDELLDWLEANRFLSNDRFVESRVHARQARFGNLRIRSELSQHGVAPPSEVERSLVESELERAAAVRARRFREPPNDAAERAAQSRFLAGRGFSPETIQRLMRQLRAGLS